VPVRDKDQEDETSQVQKGVDMFEDLPPDSESGEHPDAPQSEEEVEVEVEQPKQKPEYAVLCFLIANNANVPQTVTLIFD